MQLSDNLPFLLGLDSSSFFGRLSVNNFPNKAHSANTTHDFRANYVLIREYNTNLINLSHNGVLLTNFLPVSARLSHIAH